MRQWGYITVRREAHLMVFWAYRLLKKLRLAIAANREPILISRGVALGFVLGMIPSGNLTSLLILVVIFCLRLNHAVAALTAVATSWCVPLLDPATHWIGLQILSDPPLADLFASAWNYPFVAWTNLNNTVVLGSVVLAITFYLPVERTSHSIIQNLTKAASNRDQESGETLTKDESHQDACHQINEANEPHQLQPSQPQSQNPERSLKQHSIDLDVQPPSTSATERAKTRSVSHEPVDPLSIFESNSTRIETVRIQSVGNSENEGIPANPDAEPHPMDPQLRKLLSRLREQGRRIAS